MRRQQPHFKDPKGIVQWDADGYGLIAVGTSVPSGVEGYQKGCFFFDTDASAGAMLFTNAGTTSSCTFVAVPTGGTTGAADVGIADGGGFTATTTVETALQEIYQHLLSTQVVVPISLASLREVDSSGDVGTTSSIGGVLASNTTPILRAGTTECFEVFYAANDVDITAISISLPEDLDDTADAYVDLYVQANTTDQAPTFTINSSWQAGTQVADTATAVTATTVQTITATIASGDIPAGVTFVTLQLVPAAHATSSFQLHGARLRYKGVLRTS